MTAKPGFKLSRSAVMRSTGPVASLPEQGDTQRLEWMTNSLKNLGDDRAAYADEISKLWGEAQERFLTIGRYLMRAKERLPHGAFEAMVAADLPFGKVVAYQLRIVAMAVDGGRIEEGELPRSYATAFKIAKLDDNMLARARQEKIVRVDVTREEVTRFLRRLSEDQQGLRPRREALVARRDALKRRLRALAAEQRDVQKKLAHIEAELGGNVMEGEVADADV